MALYGRESERAALGALLDAVRESRSEVLVLRGEPGVGKTALLEDAMTRASGMRVLHAAGVKGEAELAFAGLHQLVWPLRALVARLAPAQAAALSGALGLADGTAPDRFLIGAATLELLAAAADEQPLLCVVDDAQWMDGPSAEALAFAWHRLHAEPVGALLTVRTGIGQVFDWAGLRTIHVGGLGQDAAEVLLLDRAGEPLEPRRRAWILELAQGNPLALLELPISVGGQLSGLRRPDQRLPLTPALEDAFLARARTLPAGSRRLLLLAAAADTGDPAGVLGAAAQLGIGDGDIAAAEAAGLIQVGTERIQFRHPLVSSAVYDSAPFSERSAAHQALARSALDPDRCAWHQAQALAGPDDAAADALAESAARARARSGFGAAAAALRRASALTTDPGRRAARLVGAAEAAWLAGQADAAVPLLHEARGVAADATVRAEADYIQALIEIADATPADAYLRLTRAADEITMTDPGLAQKLLLQAREAAVLSADTQAEALVSRRAEQLSAGSDRFPAQFLGGMTRWLDGDINGAVPRLRHALGDAEEAGDPRRLFWAGIAAFVLGDDARTRQFFQRDVDKARSEGAVAMVTQALTMLASSELLHGRAASARASAAEGLELARATAQRNIACFHLAILARIEASFGTEEETQSRVAECYENVLTRRLPLIDHMVSVALGEMELARAGPSWRWPTSLTRHGRVPVAVIR